jgi:hypothetical protein
LLLMGKRDHHVWASVAILICCGCPNMHVEEGRIYEVPEHYFASRDAGCKPGT